MARSLRTSGSHRCFGCAHAPSRRLTAFAACQSSRRRLIVAGPTIAVLQTLFSLPAGAFEAPPPGYRRYVDQLDGFDFSYPESWIGVTSSGNEVFKRNPRVADENAFIVISSPSSSKYDSIADFGSPDRASERLQDQFLREYMSTRIGVRRDLQPLFVRSRTGGDGKLYYDVGVRVQSFASRQQLAVSEEQRSEATVQEYDRVLISTLGVANKRLYQFRLQTPYKRYAKDPDQFETMLTSFRCKEVE